MAVDLQHSQLTNFDAGLVMQHICTRGFSVEVVLMRMSVLSSIFMNILQPPTFIDTSYGQRCRSSTTACKSTSLMACMWPLPCTLTRLHAPVWWMVSREAHLLLAWEPQAPQG